MYLESIIDNSFAPVVWIDLLSSSASQFFDSPYWCFMKLDDSPRIVFAPMIALWRDWPIHHESRLCSEDWVELHRIELLRREKPRNSSCSSVIASEFCGIGDQSDLSGFFCSELKARLLSWLLLFAALSVVSSAPSWRRRSRVDCFYLQRSQWVLQIVGVRQDY